VDASFGNGHGAKGEGAVPLFTKSEADAIPNGLLKKAQTCSIFVLVGSNFVFNIWFSVLSPVNFNF
jgi:hypothetical protein